MSFFTKIVALFKGLFSGPFGETLLSVIVNLVGQAGRVAVDELTEAAKKKAVEVEDKYPEGSGQLKRNEVLDFLAKMVASKGFAVGASVLALIVEIAVNSLKNEGKA